MALRSLLARAVRERPKATRPFFSNFTPLPVLTQQPPLPFSLPTRWIIFRPPLYAGPLFLSPHPWMLSQSATPLLFQRAAVRHPLKLDRINFIDIGNRTNEEISTVPVVYNVERKLGHDLVKVELTKSFLNAPNFISFLRLLSGPFIGWMIVNEMHTVAFVSLAISGSTDWLDGFVARKMKIDSVVGSYLDPLADKVLIGSVAAAMVLMDLLHAGLVGLIVFRDVGLVGGAVIHRARSLGWKWNSWFDFVNLDGTQPEKVQPLFISKINTVLQLALVSAALLQPEFGTTETQFYVALLSWLVAATTVASMLAYGGQYISSAPMLQAKKAWKST